MAKITKRMKLKPAAIQTYVDKGQGGGYKVDKVSVSGTGKTSKKFNIYKKG